MKKILSLALVGVIAVGAMGMSFAASPFGAAEIYANLAEISVEAAYAVKLESGDTFGELAEENGFYESFKEAVYASKLAMIQTMVEEGELSQSEADAIVASLENCDGTQQHLLRGQLNFGQRNGSFKNSENVQRGMGGMMRRGGWNN